MTKIMNKDLTPHLLKQIQSAPLLKSLSESQLEKLMEHCSIQRLQEGQFLFHQQDPFHSFFLLSSGMVKLFRLTPSGCEKIIDIIRPNDAFAEAVMFMGITHYPVHAVALKKSIVISVNSEAYKEILEDSVDVCFKMMGNLSQRLHHHVNEVERLSLHNATFRLVNYLLDFKKNIQKDHDEIHLDVSKQIIASQLAITPETLSRILKQLSNKKLITVHDDHILLNDEAGLVNIVESAIS